MLQNGRKNYLPIFLFAFIIVATLTLTFIPLQNFSLQNFAQSLEIQAQEKIAKQRNSHVTLNESFFNFGTINQGEEIRYEVSLSNTAKSPFVINQVITDLGLKVNLPEHRVIKPNEPFKLTMYLNSNSFEGKIVKRLKIITSEPKVKPLLFELKGKILPKIELEPKFINFEKSNNYSQNELNLRINGDLQASQLEITIPSNKFVEIQREDKKNNIHLLLTIMQNKKDILNNKPNECVAQRLIVSYPADKDMISATKDNLGKKYRVIPIYINCDKKIVKNS